MAADLGKFLKATARYTDGHGSSKSASATTAAAVLAAAVTHTSPSFTGTTAARSVAENTTSGNVGAALIATDTDGDTLTYSVAATTDTDAADHLAAFNRDFSLNTSSGQITVKSDAAIDFETRSSYKVIYRVSDSEDSTGATDTAIDDTLTLTISVTNADDAGTVAISGTVKAGVELTASVSDPDGSVTSVTWQWSRSDNADGTGNPTNVATTDAYTPVAADVGKYLTATASYTDALGSGKTASATTAAVSASDLVRNLDVPASRSHVALSANTTEIAQSFGTGSTAATLTGVRLDGGFSTDTVLSIYSNNSSLSEPGSSVATLTNPSGLTGTVQSSNSVQTFTASGSGVSLAANTTYWVVLTGAGRLSQMQSQDETGAAGWSIGNNFRSLFQGSWSATRTFVLRVALEGTITGSDQVHTSPVFFTGTTAARSVAENSTSGSVGVVITAVDADGDTLTYSVAATSESDGADHLTAFNRDFSLDTSSGQITVKSGAAIDFEALSSYKVLYRVSDSEDSTGATDTAIDDTLTLTISVTNADDPGTVTITGTAQAGTALTASLSDSDVPVSASVTWQWSRSDNADGTGNVTNLATTAAYTPVAADEGKYLTATASYTDGHGSSKTASATTAVVAAAVTTPDDRPGTVTISGTPEVGTALTASLSDPDVPVPASVTWQWSSSDTADGVFTSNDGVTANYTPGAADEGKFLRATASYTDGHGGDKTANGTTASAVIAATAATATLVSNLNESGRGSESIASPVSRVAQSFTTGGSAATLTAVRINGTFSTGTVVSISNNSSSLPGSRAATLTNPSGLTGTEQSSFSVQTFTASGSGVSLTANTTYWVVMSGAGTASNTTSGDESGMTGWSIANTYQYRFSGTWTENTSRALRIEIKGTVAMNSISVDAPGVVGAPSVSGAGSDGQWTPGETVEVTLAFDEAVVVDTTDGTSSVGVSLSGSAARSATYVRGSGSTGLVFGYTLVDDDGSHSIMFVPADSLALNGGTIRIQSGSVDAVLGHSAIAVGGTVTSDSGSGGSGGSLSSLADEILGWSNQGTSNSGGFSARFEGLPERHDGTNAFSFELHFSEDPDELSYRTVGGGLLDLEGAAVTRARRLVHGSDLGWELTVVPSQNGDITVRIPRRDCDATASVCASGQPLGEGLSDTVPGPDSAGGGPPAPLTASTHDAAASHDGSTEFTFELRFSEEFTISYETLRDHAFTVTGGKITRASRLAGDSATPNVRWEITVRPLSNATITIELPATADCAATGAICTQSGKKLTTGVELTVTGP